MNSSKEAPRNSLYVKLEKREFHKPSVKFLGYILDENIVKMDQSKMEAATSWPHPRTVKNTSLQSLI